MRQALLLILLVIVSGTMVGQNSTSPVVSIEAYNNIDGLQLLKSVNETDLIGVFKFQGGSYQWFYLSLDSNKTYKIRSQDCINGKIIKRGYWSISFGRMLNLQSTNRNEMFDVILQNQKYILVEPNKRNEFIQVINLKKAAELYFYTKPI